MRSGPPQSQVVPLVESPVDQAHALYLSSKQDEALRLVASFLQSDFSMPSALLLCGILLAERQRPEAAREAFDLCARDAIDEGNLPLAIAASCNTRRLGTDANQMFHEIANAFGHGSPRLKHRSTPPSLPFASIADPIPASLAGRELSEHTADILQTVRTRREDLERFRGQPPSIAPVPLFSDLRPDSLRALIEKFEVAVVPKGAVVIEEGDDGTEAYIVARGVLEARRMVAGTSGTSCTSDTSSAKGTDNEHIVLARLTPGTLFGEMALLSCAPRAASVVACSPSILLVARKDDLDDVALHHPAVGSVLAKHCQRRMVQNLIRTSAILRAVDEEKRPALIARFVTRCYKPCDKLIAQGETADGLHLIASGEVLVSRQEGNETLVLAKLGPGDVVGEVSLVLRKPSDASFIARHATVSLHLPTEEFSTLIRQHPAVLSEIYDLAVRHDQETLSIVAQEALDVDDSLLI